MRLEVLNMTESSENGPKALPGQNGPKNLSKALQVQVFQDDCWLCRYCKRPVG